MAAAQSCIGGCHIFETTVVGSFEVGLEVGPGLVCGGFVISLLDGPIEHAGVLQYFLPGADTGDVVNGTAACVCKCNNVLDALPEWFHGVLGSPVRFQCRLVLAELVVVNGNMFSAHMGENVKERVFRNALDDQ